MIYLVGDSHTIMHKGLEPGINAVHCGACTAYSLMDPASKTNSFKTLVEIYSKAQPHTDTFVFLFGEIDCRVLIYHHHVKYDISILQMIDIVIYRYFAAIQYCRDMNFQVAIHGVVPAVRQENEYNIEHYGSPKIRASINRMFNDRCQYKARLERIPYFNCMDRPYFNSPDAMVPVGGLLPDLVHVDPDKIPIAMDFCNWLKFLDYYKLRGEP